MTGLLDSEEREGALRERLEAFLQERISRTSPASIPSKTPREYALPLQRALRTLGQQQHKFHCEDDDDPLAELGETEDLTQ